jgi:hypothetical protein
MVNLSGFLELFICGFWKPIPGCSGSFRHCQQKLESEGDKGKNILSQEL